MALPARAGQPETRPLVQALGVGKSFFPLATGSTTGGTVGFSRKLRGELAWGTNTSLAEKQRLSDVRGGRTLGRPRLMAPPAN